MSFASECKDELMTIKRSTEENKALLLGMILSGATYDDRRIVFSAANREIANYFAFLFKRIYGIDCEEQEVNLQSASFLHSYESIASINEAIFNELEILDLGGFRNTIKEKQEMGTAYLSGAFLARGSVNNPDTSKYHFEITLNDAKNATFVQQIANGYNLNTKIIRRRNKYVVYLKDAEKIVDILRLMGARKNSFNFESIRIDRDFNNSLNRIINCELANEAKSIAAAREQLRYIKYLEYNYPLEKLDPKILTLMKVRKDNPEASFMELITILNEEYGENISKPGLSHRFAKIKSIAIDHYKNKIK